MCIGDFNSNMVRLKECNNISTNVKTIIFQFQYGSIKSTKSKAMLLLRELFQFQYGSIKRDHSTYVSFFGKLFQFQYGSIKRRILAILLQFDLLNFNSNMVRLKVLYSIKNGMEKMYFNSNMVRLKVEKTSNDFRLFNGISIPIWFD